MSLDYFALAVTDARAIGRRLTAERTVMASTFDVPDPGTDPAYCDGLGGHPGIAMHCMDCNEIVWVSRDEPYPGPALRCAFCAAHPLGAQQTDERKAG